MMRELLFKCEEKENSQLESEGHKRTHSKEGLTAGSNVR